MRERVSGSKHYRRKDALVEQAVLNQKIDDLSSSKDSLGCELMDLITPIPSVLNQRFNEMYAQDKTGNR